MINMDFRIADSFTDSLAKLTNDEQKLVKTTAFDLQMNPAGNGNSFHKLDHSRDPRFWSVRVSSDLRIIVHKTPESLLLCYVNHHDKAYEWAEKRKLETHPKTGAAQIVELKETIQEIIVQQIKTEVPYLFADISSDDLIRYGIPVEFVQQIKKIQDEDTLFRVISHLPQEAGEVLLELATGNKPDFPAERMHDESPFNHPDAMRHFRIIKNKDELEQAFEAPWEKWIVFLHPEQRKIVEKDYTGPARVSGSAGTGKTVVALHRAVALARKHEDARVLLTTFSRPLANALKVRLNWLLRSTPRIGDQIELHSLKDYALNLYRARIGRKPNLVSESDLSEIIKAASEKAMPHKFSLFFLVSEWKEIVDAFQLKSWEEYRNVPRLGRKTRLPEAQRQVLWKIFEQVRGDLKARSMITLSEVFEEVTESIRHATHSPIDYAVVDEAQDISVPELRFLAVLGKNQPDSLFFAGDSGQRIFQPPFSWKQQGVSIRGRSATLKINYRTSHQIRTQADQLLPNEVSDVDGNVENRKGTISIFDGPAPQIQILNSEIDEVSLVAKTIKIWRSQGIKPEEIGIFTRSVSEFPRAQQAVENAGENFDCINDLMEPAEDCIAIGTMHQAKGLEYRAVVVMACDEDIIPSQERIETVADESDLEDVYNTERYLLYVACTRARENLLVTGIKPGSELLADMISSS